MTSIVVVACEFVGRGEGGGGELAQRGLVELGVGRPYSRVPGDGAAGVLSAAGVWFMRGILFM